LTDPDGNEATYAYNNANQLTSETQGYGTSSAITSSYTYDPDGNQLTYTNGLSGTTTYTYDFLDRPTSAKDALGKTTTYAYDGDGNQTSLTNPDGKTTTWAYNGDDQVSSVSYSDGTTPGVSYTYTPDGDVATMADGTGTSTYTYDQAGELLGYRNGAGATVAYSYDADGNIATLVYPNGQQVARSYDPLDRLSSLTDWLGGTTTFSYDADSDLTGVSFPNGVADANSYNAADQLGSVTDTKGSTTLASFSYSRDHDGSLSSETDTGVPGPATTNYTYNPLQELTAAGSNAYGYDAAQDLTEGPGGTTQAYNADGELCWSKVSGSGACTSPPTGATTYSYSAEGNLTGVTPSSGSATTFAWDEANRLRQATTGSQTTSFAYDGNGLRQSETNGSTTTEFTWDVEGSLPMLLSDGANSYIYGPSSAPVEQISSSGTPTYLLSDQLGSTRALTNSSGSVTATFSYDPWGNLTGSTGSAATPFMYAGQYYDSATGLYYMQARYYDPVTGQFMSLDPDVAQTNTPFGYGGDNPLNLVDPEGTMAIGPGTFPPYCEDTYITCATLDVNYSPQQANNEVADLLEPSLKEVYFQSTMGYPQRHVDVYSYQDEGLIAEAKTGSQGLSWVKNGLGQQILGDLSLKEQGFGIPKGKYSGLEELSISEALWFFFPNSTGVTEPSVPLINALNESELPTFVFFNQSGAEPPGNVPVTAPSLDLLRDIVAEGLAAAAAAAAARGLRGGSGGGVGGPEPTPCPPVTPIFA